MTKTLYSALDKSVNFILPHPAGGYSESRFVQREEGYISCYLSSMNGCPMACRFCHLTQTGQTYSSSIDSEGFFSQAEKVMKHYSTLPYTRAKRVHYNFMARGEALDNKHIRSNWEAIVDRLDLLAYDHNMWPKFNISTIMPSSMLETDLSNVFTGDMVNDVILYYSLYSTNHSFRRKWLPNALDSHIALRKLADWQQKTGNLVCLHWAYIKDENDSAEDTDDIIYAVRQYGLDVKVNIVRYNPPNDKSEESSEDVINRNFKMLEDAFGNGSRIVPRVGQDVYASCGMFVGDKK